MKFDKNTGMVYADVAKCSNVTVTDGAPRVDIKDEGTFNALYLMVTPLSERGLAMMELQKAQYPEAIFM